MTSKELTTVLTRLKQFVDRVCDKCLGRGEVDMNACHGFGNGPRKYWPCTACDGTGMKKPEQARETD